METSIRIPLDEYHEYMGYINATVQAGQMLSFPYPGGIIWKHDKANVTISGADLANALADGAILVAVDAGTAGVSMIPIFRHAFGVTSVTSLAIINASDTKYQWTDDQVGPVLLTRNPIEFYE